MNDNQFVNDTAKYIIQLICDGSEDVHCGLLTFRSMTPKATGS